MNEIHVSPIAVIRNTRQETEVDKWGGLVSEIVLDPSLPEESLEGLGEFSHAEIIYHFHLVEEKDIQNGRRWVFLHSAAACVRTV
jgi:tRNA (Thr-GGU) A37 N-methylase